MRIALVEDDAAIAGSLGDALRADGYDVVHVRTGRAALELEPCDLVLLDLGLPDIDGREVCRQLRANSDVPIIMLTARADEVDRVVGFELGADDYVTKPFSSRELAARIRAVTRRAVSATDAGHDVPDVHVDRDHSRTDVGPLAVDRRTRRVRLDGREIVLTAKEFDLLAFLARDPGAVFSRIEILEEVWDSNWYGPTKTVDAHVASLRKKLGSAAWIEAVRGVGFRLEAPG